MAAPTTTPARASEAEQIQTSVNEPSMEDILASIRRIIAEDQSNSLNRSGIGGLTRRVAAAAARPAAEPPIEVAVEEPPAATVPSSEPDAHAAAQADRLQATYEAVAAPVAGFDTVRHEEPTPAVSYREPSYEADAGLRGYVEDHVAPQAATLAVADDTAEPLMSASAGASITSSFHSLAESVVLQDPGLIERVMRESMRPLLKAWLDDHLPSIVERLVRAEIERVARGGRSRNI